MPWKVNDVMTERMRFILRHQDGERMTDLCKEFKISRKTGYKFLKRYKKYSVAGLRDRPPVTQPRYQHQAPWSAATQLTPLRPPHSTFPVPGSLFSIP